MGEMPGFRKDPDESITKEDHHVSVFNPDTESIINEDKEDE